MLKHLSGEGKNHCKVRREQFSFPPRTSSTLRKYGLTQFSEVFFKQRGVNIVSDVSDLKNELWKAHQNDDELKLGEKQAGMRGNILAYLERRFQSLQEDAFLP